MKKSIITIAVLFFSFFIATSGEAYDWWAYSPDGIQDVQNIDAFNYDGLNHVKITWNNLDDTAFATVMDPDGIPIIYYYAYFYPTFSEIWYSTNGIDWDFLESYGQ